MPEINTSNHAKYVDAQSNPLVKALMGRFFKKVGERLATIQPKSLLDAGCGEGHALEELGSLIPDTYVGLDANPACIEHCRAQFPGRDFRVESVLALPFPDKSFDAVLCMEVLEHLEDPAAAVRELARVARVGLVLSVPFEPFFQLGNAARGKYASTWGNHPEHIQHWGLRSFPRFLEQTGVLQDIEVVSAGTWLIATARPS